MNIYATKSKIGPDDIPPFGCDPLYIQTRHSLGCHDLALGIPRRVSGVVSRKQLAIRDRPNADIGRDPAGDSPFIHPMT